MGSQPMLWLENLSHDIKASWPMLLDNFMKRWVSGTSSIANEQAFTSVKMKPGETPDSFYLRVLELGDLVSANDERLSTVFLSGISKEMRLFACSSEKSSSTEYLEAARLFHSMEGLSISKPKEVVNHTQDNYEHFDTDIPFYDDSRSHHYQSDDFYDDRYNYDEYINYNSQNNTGFDSFSRSGRSHRGFRGNRRPMRSRGTPRNGARSMRSSSFNSRGSQRGQPTQRSRNLRPRGTSNNMRSRGSFNQRGAPRGQTKRNFECYSCGGPHSFRDCPENPQLKSPACHFCKSKFHLKAKCPFNTNPF